MATRSHVVFLPKFGTAWGRVKPDGAVVFRRTIGLGVDYSIHFSTSLRIGTATENIKT